MHSPIELKAAMQLFYYPKHNTDIQVLLTIILVKN